MSGLGAAALLRVWEDGLDRSPTVRALAMLGAAAPDLSQDERACLSIGARDARLFRLRAVLFGDLVTAVAACPVCGEQLDISFRLSEMRSDPADQGDSISGAGPATWQAAIGGYDITFRVPASVDLLAVGQPGQFSPQQGLLSRCLVEIVGPEGETAVDGIPAEVVAELSERMAAADPQARVELDLTCGSCQHSWRSLFDIAAFLWAELNAWALRLLRDVHTLARALGWQEGEILAMSPRRRQAYLELVRS